MLREVIVVEGRNDTIAVQQAVEADTIETGGSAVDERVLAKVRLAQERRGVILFLDPDYAGERIRKIISHHVPGCKHAFLTVDAATKHGDIGVENASPEAIRTALEQARTEWDTGAMETSISWDEMLTLGLIGGTNAKKRRERLGEILGIGYGNAQQFYKRLTLFCISAGEFYQAIEQMEHEKECL